MSIAMRDAFGMKLAELGATHPELVVLDADVSSSTKSSLFAKAYPDRFFNVGVAEANMVDIAAGLATTGYHPVVNAFAIFLALKATDQIRNTLCYNNLPVVIAGAYGGLSDSFDGASHQAITDIAIMRALPNMQVIVPSDARQAQEALVYALHQNGPVYIRLNRNAMPDLPPVNGIQTVCSREGSDVTIAANGITASFADKAADLLAKQGVKAEVLSVPVVKPLDVQTLAASVRKTGKLVCVEEHVLAGGFASAVSEAFMKQGIFCRFDAMGIEDTFTESGPYEPLLAKYGISAEQIASRAKALCN
ncbi:MAG: transketolase family protein [Sphaerochaeta sp.]|jgi:transketolase|uniref:transketolase family protein n=1 Tax=Sphaerochaeta sp. TaxID=1972642 RepID=UPI002FC77023